MAVRKRKRQRIPKMGRHSSGQARVKLNGRVFYLGAHGSVGAQRRYTDLLNRWLDNGRKPLVETPVVVQVIAMAEVFAKYEAYLDKTGRYRKNGKPTSQRGILRVAIREFCEQFGDVLLPKFTEALLLQHRDYLEGQPKLTRTGINKKIAHLRAALRWSFNRGVLSRDQWLGVKAIEPLSKAEAGGRDHKRPKRAVSVADVEAVAGCLPKAPAAMLRLQSLTGMRPGDVTSMRWQDISREPVDVDGTPCLIYTVAGGKTEHHGHETVYALGPKAQAILAEFTPTKPGAYVFSPKATMAWLHDQRRASRQTPVTDYTEARDATASREFGDRYSVPTYRQAVVRACAIAEVERFTPHEVRHGFVTRGARMFGAYAASSAANHSRVSTTEGYMHRDRSDGYRVVVGLEAQAG